MDIAKCSFGRKHFKLKSRIGKTPQKLVMQVFNKTGNVSSVSSVGRILKSELKLSSYIYYIQRQDHFFENQQEKVNALNVLTFVIGVTYIHISYDEHRKTKEQSYRQYMTNKSRDFPRSN